MKTSIAASRKLPESGPIMESQQEAGDEEKMERFFELIREARSRMTRPLEREVDRELASAAAVTARQCKRRRADRCCCEGEGRLWVPKFEAEDFGVKAESGAVADACRSPRSSRMLGVREKLEEDDSGLNLKLTL